MSLRPCHLLILEQAEERKIISPERSITTCLSIQATSILYFMFVSRHEEHAAEDNEINPDAAEDSKYIKTKAS